MSTETASRQPDSLTLYQHVSRWLSPDYPLGQGLLAARMRIQLGKWRPRDPDNGDLKRAISCVAPAFTMVDLRRLRHLADLAGRIADGQVPGSVVECGTWRGGGLALMAWVLRRAGQPRPLWGFDSFEGLPPPGIGDPAEVHRQFFHGWCGASPDDVRLAFDAIGESASALHLVKGWLAETLPDSLTGPIALLNVDVDWHDSVRTVLNLLADRVSPGGFVNIDDYGRWQGCTDAVHAFFDERNLPRQALVRTGPVGAWFRRSEDADGFRVVDRGA